MRLAPVLGRLFARPNLSCRRSKRPRTQPRRLNLGTLEDRTLPAVQFVPGPLTAPVTNHPDVALGNLNNFEEPNLTVNNRGDTGNIVVTSHNISAASTNMFVTDNNGAYPVANQGDTWADFDTQGRAWWTNLDAGTGGVRVVEVNPITGNPIGNGVVVNTPPAGQSDDRQALAADSFPNSPWHDNIYVVWTRFGFGGADNTRAFVARSADHGVTWTSTDIGAAGFDQQTHIAVGSNGDVYASYHLQTGFVAGQTSLPDGVTGQVVVFRSTDGGTTWTQTGTNPFTAGQADISFNRQENAVGNFAGTDFLTQGSAQPFVLPDPVRPGQVYVIAADDTDNNHGNGDDSDLYIARSDNDGATWTRTLLPHGGGTSFQLFPTAAIDQFGTIVVTWYDNRRGLVNDGPDNIAGNADDNFLLDWMGMYSVDGGINWSAPFQINDVPFDPDETPTRAFQGGPTTRVGEYFGLDLFGGTAYVAFNGNTPGDNTTSQQVFFDAFAIRGSVVVGGDDSGPADDAFRVRRMANDPNYVEISVNGVRQYVGLQEALTQITINGLDGDDALTVDSSNGPITVSINYNGGNGFDRLNLSQTGGAAATAGTLAVGAANGSGRSTMSFAAGNQTVDFKGIEPVTDNVPAATFSITSVPGLASLLQADNTITYQGSLLLAGGGRVTVDAFEPIEFLNKQNLTIDAGAGADTVDLVNAGTPAGLTGMTVNAGSGHDIVTAAPTASTPGLVVNGGLGNDYLAANGDLNGDGGNDVLIGGASGNALSGGDGEDILDARGGSNSLDGGGDTDIILVSGTAGADTITATHGAGTFNITGGLSAGTNTVTGMEAVRVEAGDGPDRIILTLSAAGGLDYTVLGGNPIGTLAGDSLTVNSAAAMAVTAGPENDAGSVDAATATPTNVSFDEIELLILGGGGGGVVNGTNGDDAITVIARDASFNPAADGVQDFTAVVNAGLEVLYLNQPTLTVNALGGSDTIVVRAPAPNNAVWDVDVTVDGGPPSAGSPGGSDRLVVETPGDLPETAVFTPTAADAGTLDLASLSSLFTMKQIEELLYDGEADNDSLTVLGTGGDDTINHTPGASDQAGTFQVNGLLPISYQNMGGGAALTADGAGGSDTLIYLGTDGNDMFRVLNAAGDVGLNTRLVLTTAHVEALTLEGQLGDDLFDIVPPVPSLAYGRVNANGGAQASAAGDQTNLKGTAAADGIAVSGQVVSMGGVTVASSGVETINLNSGGGVPPDLLTYTGVPGVTEAISLAGSSTAGTGVLSVPGVVNLNFVGTETFMVNGDPADVDTLTVVGTNAVDRFRLNLAAAGTAGDPVLKMLNAAGTVVKLTLLNYSGFNFLNVNTQDGNDVVNVLTAATGPSRNAFVDGGLPTGKNKGTDTLNVYYAGKRPRIVHSAATQNPDSGLVTLDYGTAFYGVQYGSMEVVNILKS